MSALSDVFWGGLAIASVFALAVGLGKVMKRMGLECPPEDVPVAALPPNAPRRTRPVDVTEPPARFSVTPGREVGGRPGGPENVSPRGVHGPGPSPVSPEHGVASIESYWDGDVLLFEVRCKCADRWWNLPSESACERTIKVHKEIERSLAPFRGGAS